jgi:hypothetical protein
VGAGADAPLNGSGKDIEDVPAPNGVEDNGSHAGVDDPRGVSHRGVDGRGGRDGPLGSGTMLKIQLGWGRGRK